MLFRSRRLGNGVLKDQPAAVMDQLKSVEADILSLIDFIDERVEFVQSALAEHEGFDDLIGGFDHQDHDHHNAHGHEHGHAHHSHSRHYDQKLFDEKRAIFQKL